MNVIYQLTIQAIKQDEEVVALQAIEFWSTIAEEELSLEVEVRIRSRAVGKEFCLESLRLAGWHRESSADLRSGKEKRVGRF